jgi:hypothetical protein
VADYSDINTNGTILACPIQANDKTSSPSAIQLNDPPYSAMSLIEQPILNKKATVLRYHRCLINTGVEKIINI